MGGIDGGGRKARRNRATSDGMKRSAKTRTCPACGRQGAMSTISRDACFVSRGCRWCPYRRHHSLLDGKFIEEGLEEGRLMAKKSKLAAADLGITTEATKQQIDAAKKLLAAGWSWNGEAEFTPDKNGLLHLYGGAVYGAVDALGLVYGPGAGPKEPVTVEQSVKIAQAQGKKIATLTTNPVLGGPFTGDIKLPPECSVCQGRLWIGNVLIVLDSSKLAHLSCHEGTKVHAAKDKTAKGSPQECVRCHKPSACGLCDDCANSGEGFSPDGTITVETEAGPQTVSYTGSKQRHRVRKPARAPRCSEPACDRAATGDDGRCDACSCQGDDLDRCPRDSDGDKLHRPKTKAEALVLVKRTFAALKKLGIKAKQIKKPEKLEAFRVAADKAAEAYRFASSERDRIFGKG